MQIRSALPEDNSNLLNIFRDSVLKGCENVYGNKVVKAWAAPTNKRFKFVVPERSFVCIKDGKIIAFAGWRPQGEGSGLARVASCFVRPEFMGQGIGKHALGAVHDDIRGQDYPYIHLYAVLNAVSFYRSQGYQKEDSHMMKVAEGHYIATERMTMTA